MSDTGQWASGMRQYTGQYASCKSHQWQYSTVFAPAASLDILALRNPLGRTDISLLFDKSALRGPQGNLQ